MLRLTVKGAQDLERVARDLRRAKGTLRRELTSAFKSAGNETLRRVKRNVETMDIRGYRTRSKHRFVHHGGSGGIRRRISRATELDVSSSAADPRVRFQVDTASLGNARNVPWHLDQGRVFRHPVMGNRNAWAGSSGTPWFYNEIRSDVRVFEDRCDDAIDRTIRSIEG